MKYTNLQRYGSVSFYIVLALIVVVLPVWVVAIINGTISFNAPGLFGTAGLLIGFLAIGSMFWSNFSLSGLISETRIATNSKGYLSLALGFYMSFLALLICQVSGIITVSRVFLAVGFLLTFASAITLFGQLTILMLYDKGRITKA